MGTDDQPIPGCDGYVGGQAPVQGCGRVDGYPWYFRARHDAWSMEIANDKSIDPESLPWVPHGVGGWLVEEDWGTGFDASYMPEDVAWQLIARVVAAFRADDIPYTYPMPA